MKKRATKTDIRKLRGLDNKHPKQPVAVAIAGWGMRKKEPNERRG
jgi:hypothetical protein